MEFVLENAEGRGSSASGRLAIAIVASAVVLAGCSNSPTSPTLSSLDPAADVAPPAPPPHASKVFALTSRTRYLAFGDSLTSGITSLAAPTLMTLSSGLPESYPFKLETLLAARYAIQQIVVVNEGKPGEAAAEAVHRFPDVFRAVHPEVVILLHGVNDVTQLGLAGVGRVAESLNTMAREARLGGAQVVICTYPPQRAEGFRAAPPLVMGAYNTALRDVARGEGAMLIDFERDVDVQLTGIDGLHPTAEGFTRMAHVLYGAIRLRFEVRR